MCNNMKQFCFFLSDFNANKHERDCCHYSTCFIDDFFFHIKKTIACLFTLFVTCVYIYLLNWGVIFSTFLLLYNCAKTGHGSRRTST